MSLSQIPPIPSPAGCSHCPWSFCPSPCLCRQSFGPQALPWVGRHFLFQEPLSSAGSVSILQKAFLIPSAVLVTFHLGRGPEPQAELEAVVQRCIWDQKFLFLLWGPEGPTFWNPFAGSFLLVWAEEGQLWDDLFPGVFLHISHSPWHEGAFGFRIRILNNTIVGKQRRIFPQ